ncbi:MAG: hypothetical protein JSR53_00330 [Proteobacteria bacterium]|nr:hypothetical protein [Pseudomonadota bacterium]
MPTSTSKSTEYSSLSTFSQESGATSGNRIVVLKTLTDDGAGAFLGGMGTVNYVGKQVTFKAVAHNRSTTAYKSDYEKSDSFNRSVSNSSSSEGGSSSDNSGSYGYGNSSKGGDYGTAAVGEEMFGGSSVVARYRVGASAPVAHSQSFTPDAVSIDLCPYTAHRIVPGSVLFRWMGHEYSDFEGMLYRGRTDSTPGIASGSIDYASGLAFMSDYVVGGTGPADFQLLSLWTQNQPWNTASVFFRTQAAPIKPTGAVLTLLDTKGDALTATADLNGNFLGTHMWGKIDYLTGLVELQFGDFVDDATLTAADKAEWWYSASSVGTVHAGKIWRPWPVDPTTLRYNSVSYFYLPIDAEILGLDPVRLPQDGRVPIFRVGSYVVIGHTGTTPPATVSNGTTINCARTRLSRVRLVGASGATIHTGYTADLDAGTVTAVDTSTWVQPVHVEHRIEQLERLRDVQIGGEIATVGQLAHDFPAGSTVSSAITAPTLRARVAQFWDQQTWDGITWADNIVGNPAPATYNDTLAPVELTNAGALTEKFALRFTNSTTFECIGEHVGFIGTGNINTDFAPINPVGAAPYFTLRALGWGTGWAAGNVQFIHVSGAITPFACIRTVQMGPALGVDYQFELLGRGDVDRPPSNP